MKICLCQKFMKGDIDLPKIKCRFKVLFLIFVLQLLLLSGCGLSKPEQKSDIDTGTGNEEIVGASTDDEEIYHDDASGDDGSYPMENAVEGVGNMSADGQKAPEVVLNSGYEMPVLGLGTYSLLEDECVDSVYTAIASGYRLHLLLWSGQGEQSSPIALKMPMAVF